MKVQFRGAPHLTEYHGLVDDSELHLVKGAVVEVSAEAGAILVADFPGIFVPVADAAGAQPAVTTPLLQAMISAPADKQIHEGKPRGGRKGAARR